MNNKLILLGLTLTLLGCATFKQNKATDFTLEHKTVAQNGMNIPILTNEKDKAPSLDYIRKKIKQEAFLFINGKQPEFVDSVSVGYPTISQFTEIVNDTLTLTFGVKDIHGNYVNEIIEYKKETKNHRDVLGQDFYIKYIIWRKYYPNGQLKSYEIYLNHPHSSGIRLGTWYRFDEEGNLLQTIDHEKHFKTTYLDVMKIALSYRDRYYKRFSRIFTRDMSYWAISFPYHMEERKPRFYVIIDDETGKVVGEYADGEEIPKIYNAEYQKEVYDRFYRQ